MIFFGSKLVQRELPSEQKVCPNCLSVTRHVVVEHDTRFTLYFIPLFSIKRDVSYTCSVCGDTHMIAYNEYQAAHPDSAPVSENATGDANASGGKSKSRQDKARTILEGKVVGDQIKTSRPFSANFNADQFLKYFYIAFVIIALLAALLLFIIVSALSR